MTETRTVSVYAFRDSDGQARYVGQTVNLNNRLNQHWTSRLNPDASANPRLSIWIASLQDKPTPEVLATTTYEQRHVVEKEWISRLRAQGHDLLNGVGTTPRTSWGKTRVAMTRVAVRVSEALDEEAKARGISRGTLVRQIITEWAEAKWRQAAGDEVSR